MNKLLNLLGRKVDISIPLWCFILLPLLLYAGWEYYWYTKVGLRIVKWHTHLAVYLYLFAGAIFIFQLLFAKSNSEKAQNIFMVFMSLLFSLGMMEAFLQVSGLYKTYLEKVSGFYDSPYTPQDRTYYHTWTPNKKHWITKPEYSYERPTNSLGFGDEEWSVSKLSGTKRIMSLGDSFTEGDGAPYDSTYVSLLKKKLLETGYTFDLMNAGVCGSDPFNNYIILKDKLLDYKPDIILQTLATNDMNTDILLRGGMERFQKDGTLKYNNAPWWEPIYAVSYISRIFFRMAGYHELLQRGAIKPAEEERVNRQLSGLFKVYANLCKEHNIRLMVVLRPDKAEIEHNAYDYNFSPVLDQLYADSTVVFIDLLPSYQKYIETRHTKAADYFWKLDGHHNSTGYEMMAQTIFEKIQPLLNDSVSSH